MSFLCKLAFSVSQNKTKNKHTGWVASLWLKNDKIWFLWSINDSPWWDSITTIMTQSWFLSFGRFFLITGTFEFVRCFALFLSRHETSALTAFDRCQELLAREALVVLLWFWFFFFVWICRVIWVVKLSMLESSWRAEIFRIKYVG